MPNNQIFNAYTRLGRPAIRSRLQGRKKQPTTWLVSLDAIVSVTFLAIVALFYRWYGKR